MAKVLFEANGTGRASPYVELWVTDGTAAGTYLLTDFIPGLPAPLGAVVALGTSIPAPAARVPQTSQHLATARRCSTPMMAHMALSCG